MIDQIFCDALELAISGGLANSSEKTVRNVCTDGILFDPSDRCFARKFVSDHKYVAINLYAITGPVAMYQVVLLFGNEALSRYARGLDLLGCIPANLDESNMQVSFKKAEILVALL